MNFRNIFGKSVSERLRFLFIAPGNLAGDFSNVPNGIGILAAILQMNGVFVKIKDYSVEELDYEELKTIIKDNKINIVGITMMTCQALVGYEIARFIKTIEPNIILLSGGIHPTVIPEESLENGIDLVFRDESVRSFCEVVPLLAQDGIDPEKLKNIRGLTFKRNDEVISTPDSERVENLDSLPRPAYDLFLFPEKYTTQFLYKKGYSTNLITSIGCTGHCVFCSKHYQGVYFQSAERVVEDFIFLRDTYNISQIFVQDDLFTYDLDRVNKICGLLIKEKVNIPWICSNTRADSISYALFKKMKDSGCISVAFGVESGNERVRKKIGKNLKTEDIVNAVALAKKAGLLTSAFYIFGHHCETWNDALDTFRFAKKLNTDTVCFSVNCPYPGTPLYRLLEKKGVELTKDWGKYRTWGEPLFETEYLSKDQVVKLQKMAYRQYYLRPRYLARQVHNLFTSGNFLMYWRGFTWLLEQYFDYKVFSENVPEHISHEKETLQHSL